MTANELADWLDRRREAYEPNGWAADMLRQQAKEIKALHNLVKEQDKKIINLSMDVVYANRTIELINKEIE